MAKKEPVGNIDKKADKLNQEELFVKILAHITHHDPNLLTYSMISRLTGVPRSTLYYYFGRNKNALINEAVKYGMDAFTQIYKIEDDFKQYSTWIDFQKARLLKALKLIELNPWAPPLYFRYRSHAGEWGVLIREMELLYSQHLASIWERFHNNKITNKSIHFATYLKLGVFWGLASEGELWFGQASQTEQLADLLTQLVTIALETV